jgi:uncharacterized protein YdhG (YjbR/CyaY superfamily)
MKKPATVDVYIQTFPLEVQKQLNEMRQVIRENAPEAEELISYSMPAYKQNGMLVWFAAHSNHVGFYPRGSGIEEFREALKGYKVSKGTIQFPLDKPLPVELIAKIVQFRIVENMQKGRR